MLGRGGETAGREEEDIRVVVAMAGRAAEVGLALMGLESHARCWRSARVVVRNMVGCCFCLVLDCASLAFHAWCEGIEGVHATRLCC